MAGNRLAAAVSDAGALGSVPTTLRTPAQVRDDVRRLRHLTDRPFALNMTRRPFDSEMFDAVTTEAPPVFSLALGEPDDLVTRVHDAGAVFLQQLTTVEQAVRAAEAGVDVISAQGTESGGFCGDVSTVALVPQVVDRPATSDRSVPTQAPSVARRVGWTPRPTTKNWCGCAAAGSW